MTGVGCQRHDEFQISGLSTRGTSSTGTGLRNQKTDPRLVTKGALAGTPIPRRNEGSVPRTASRLCRLMPASTVAIRGVMKSDLELQNVTEQPR